ncbi:glutaredoxin family protein [Marinobacter sp. OP 3.4]|uniref:glutaredoxin family protein n=1 Tax=Marinobacter sp. OP 3.4 TaxID=3076501 RepID=UPI002E2011A8
MQLTFFTTSQCHLCELAENLLVHTPMPEPIPVEAVDIASSEELVERYGTRIPVLRREDTGAELGWPFTRDDLLDFLAPPSKTPSSGQLH